MGFRLVVRAFDIRRSVAVEAPPHATLRDLWNTAVPEAPIGEGGSLIVERLGSVPADTRLSDTGLRDGDLIETGSDAPDDDAKSGVALEITGGDGIGQRFALSHGPNDVGREPTCNVVVDDLAMGRQHFSVTIDGEDDGRISIVDLGSKNGTFLNGRVLKSEIPLDAGAVIEAGRHLFTVRNLNPPAGNLREGDDGIVWFNRPPQSPEPPVQSEFEIEVPSAPATRSALQFGAMLLPLLMGIIFWQVFGQVYMLLFTLLSPALLLWNWVSERRSDKRSSSKAGEAFREQLQETVRRVDLAWRETLSSRIQRHPSPSALLDAALHGADLLWSRSVTTSNQPPSVTVGFADQHSGLSIRIEEGDPSLEDEAKSRLEPYLSMPSAPVAVDLDGVTGIVGSRPDRIALGNWVMTQLASLYSPIDLAIALITSEQTAGDFESLTWLPHCQRAGTNVRFDLLAATSPQSGRLMADLKHLIASRRQTQTKENRPWIVTLVDDVAGIDRSLASELFEAGDVGLSVVWLSERREDLPGAVNRVVNLDASGRLTVTDMRVPDSTIEGTADVVPEPALDRLARALAPLRDLAGGSSGGVPNMVRLEQAANLSLTTDAMVQAWSGTAPNGLRAVIGLSSEGPVALDIEKNGPHGLVGGTTGAGKSELLQTVIGSLAATYGPDRLNFLLVDYKGGAAFGACSELPHSVGMVTDLDPNLSRRALVALNAEVRRREHLLAEARCSDIAEMRSRGLEGTPASLLIVVDEFATLADELEEFVDGVVDIARRGRSLGMHLILATQSPDQTIRKSIQDNTNWRIALRVTSEAASANIIGSAAAAALDPSIPGRGILKAAADRALTFQAAYLGATSEGAATGTGISIRPVSLLASPEPIAAIPHAPGSTDLERLVDAAKEAVDALALPPPHRPWVPPLELLVPAAGLEAVSGIPIAKWDRPSLQRHDVFTLDLSTVPLLMVYGGPTSGKTTLLRTLAVGASRSLGSSPHWVYAIDGGGGGIDAIENLPSVGSVVRASDTDLALRLVGVLERESARRRVILDEAGAARFDDLPETSRPPRVLVLVDDYRGVATALERVDHGTHLERLQRLAATGPTVGINFVITAVRRSDVPGTLSGIARDTLVLALPSMDEYAQLGIQTNTVPAEMPPGRALFAGELLQVAVVGTDHTGVAQNRAIRELADQVPALEDATAPPRLAVLGTDVQLADLPRPPSAEALPIGLDEELRPVTLDLADGGFLVAGPPRSGRSTALQTAASQLHVLRPDGEWWLLAPRRSPLTSLPFWTRLATGAEACNSAIEELAAHPNPGSLIVVIDDGEELVDGNGARTLEAMARRARDAGMIVLGAAEIHSAHRAFASWISELRKLRSGLLLTPELEVDGDLFGVRLPRSTRRTFPPGRGYLVQRGQSHLIQVAVTEPPPG